MYVKIIIATSSCDDSSMFVCSKTYVDKFSKDSLNVPISFKDILWFQYIYWYLYTSKRIISNTTTSDCGSSINGNHKLPVNLILNPFLEWSVINNFLFWKYSQEF